MFRINNVILHYTLCSARIQGTSESAAALCPAKNNCTPMAHQKVAIGVFGFLPIAHALKLKMSSRIIRLPYSASEKKPW